MSGPNESSAREQFDTSSRFPYSGTRWKIRNNYPRVDDAAPQDEKPWLSIDFRTHAADYANALLKYFHEGNIEHNFDVWQNDKRDWYHPPWLHYEKEGREPVNGLRYGGSIPPTYLGKNQDRYLQAWLNGYYNKTAATLLGKIWNNPEDPLWNQGILFDPGSVLAENVFVDEDDDEGTITYLKGAPEVDAIIAVRPSDPHTEPDPSKRLDKPVRVRLVQSDVRAKDPRSPTGWVFATFIHDSTKKNPDPNPWNNLIPVGVQWGNEPPLDQTAHDEGRVSSECWINTRALEIIDSQKGDKPWLGWHGRLNGPADNFMSTCTSCHAVAQLVPEGVKHSDPIQCPEPKKVPPEDGRPGVWIQEDERAQKWFRNLKDGQPFDEGCISTDYSQQVRIGIHNYELWRSTQPQPHITPNNPRLDLSAPRAVLVYTSA